MTARHPSRAPHHAGSGRRGTPHDLGAANAWDVVAMLRRNPHTQREIAESLGLTRATVSRLCGTLRLMGIIVDRRSQLSASAGLRPAPLDLDPAYRYMLTLDFQDARALRVAVVEWTGRSVDSSVVPVGAGDNLFAVMERAARVAADLRGAHDIGPDRLLGVGASIPATYDRVRRAVRDSENPLIDGAELEAELAGAFSFDVPILVEKDADLGAMGMWSRFDELAVLVYLYLGDRVRLGVVVDGCPLRGTSGIGVDVAHIPLSSERARCPTCGAEGCLQAILTLAGLLHLYDPDSPLALIESDPEARQRLAASFEAALRDSTAAARQAVERFGRLVGEAAGALARLFDADCVVVGGPVAERFYPRFAPTIPLGLPSQELAGGRLSPGRLVRPSEPLASLAPSGLVELAFQAWRPW